MFNFFIDTGFYLTYFLTSAHFQSILTTVNTSEPPSKHRNGQLSPEDKMIWFKIQNLCQNHHWRWKLQCSASIKLIKLKRFLKKWTRTGFPRSCDVCICIGPTKLGLFFLKTTAYTLIKIFKIIKTCRCKYMYCPDRVTEKTGKTGNQTFEPARQVFDLDRFHCTAPSIVQRVRKDNRPHE